MSQRETRLMIQGPVGQLEAVVHDRVKESGELFGSGFCAVVCHPHPLHGGTMDNKVVATLVRAYNELGVPALRFNFRGTGHSEGQHDGGIGEVEDLRAAGQWMLARYPGCKLLLAGFSFGSGVAGNGAQVLADVAHLTLVAPPVGRYGFSDKKSFPCPWTLVMGDQDELIEADTVYQWAEGITPRSSVIRMPEATHFFHGHLVDMRHQLVALLPAQLRAA